MQKWNIKTHGLDMWLCIQCVIIPPNADDICARFFAPQPTKPKLLSPAPYSIQGIKHPFSKSPTPS